MQHLCNLQSDPQSECDHRSPCRVMTTLLIIPCAARTARLARYRKTDCCGGARRPLGIRAFNHWDWKQEFVANHRAACLGLGGSSQATGLAASGPALPKEPLQAAGRERGRQDERWRREESRQLSSPATGTDSSRYTSDCDRECMHRALASKFRHISRPHR